MKRKMTEKLNDKFDKNAGIKENSKHDIALDKKCGLPPEKKGKK